eukprot:36083-Eustigmatos_ZCMA.PRE.1
MHPINETSKTGPVRRLLSPADNTNHHTTLPMTSRRAQGSFCLFRNPLALTSRVESPLVPSRSITKSQDTKG